MFKVANKILNTFFYLARTVALSICMFKLCLSNCALHFWICNFCGVISNHPFRVKSSLRYGVDCDPCRANCKSRDVKHFIIALKILINLPALTMRLWLQTKIWLVCTNCFLLWTRGVNREWCVWIFAQFSVSCALNKAANLLKLSAEEIAQFPLFYVSSRQGKPYIGLYIGSLITLAMGI